MEHAMSYLRAGCVATFFLKKRHERWTRKFAPSWRGGHIREEHLLRARKIRCTNTHTRSPRLNRARLTLGHLVDHIYLVLNSVFNFLSSSIAARCWPRLSRRRVHRGKHRCQYIITPSMTARPCRNLCSEKSPLRRTQKWPAFFSHSRRER